MTPEQLKALEDLPLEDARSPLEPFKPLILRWRRQGRSYRKILRILKDECHIEVAYGPLYRFVKRRSRPRKPQPDLEFEPVTQPVNSSSAAGSTVERKPRMTAEERAALRSSFDQPLFPTEEQKPRFVRRPGPIRNLNNETQGEK
jgi:hypothetical protein